MCLCCSPGGACFCGTNDLFRQFGALAWKNRKLKLRYWYVLLAELALPICILFAFSGIKSVLAPTTVAAFLPGKVQEQNGFYSDGTSNVNTLQSLYTTNLPTACSTSLAFYCVVQPNSACRNAFASNSAKMDLATTMNTCIATKIAIVNGGGSATGLAAQDMISWGNAKVGKQFKPFVYFDSEASLNACINSDAYSVTPTDACPTISSAVILNSAAPTWGYTVRLNQTYYQYGQSFGVPPTQDPYLDISLKTGLDTKAASRGLAYEAYGKAYANSGYLSLTDFVNSYIISSAKNGNGLSSTWTTGNFTLQTTATVDFPWPQVQMTGFWQAIGQYFALVLIIVLLYPLSNVIAVLVREKEAKLKEGMMMMAMRGDAMMLSWWLNFVALFLPLSILLQLAGQAGNNALFKYSQGFYIWVYFFTFFMGSTAFCVLVSTFFSKSRTASIVGSLLFFGGYFIYVGIGAGGNGVPPSRGQVLAACLHPAAALTYGTDFFAEYEDAQIGITSFTFNVSDKHAYTFQDIITMMFIDAFWMSFAAWYVDKIWPSEFGTHKPWYFIFQPAFWMNEVRLFCSCLFGKRKGTHLRNVSPADRDSSGGGDDGGASVEMVTANLSSQLQSGMCVDIQDLYKEFDTPQGQKKVAVNKLNLTLYSGQITALLGHNGAGKTTTIAMLTGLIPPDAGTAIIEGYSIAEDMEEIRRNLGVCPQHDILFPDLTVEEHLTLFASFKGVKGSQVKEEVEKMIQSVGLVEKRHVYSKQLSGGQKRKLSVGIAFIGGSRIVFLDEPTSGMDPYSRRFTWNIIRQHREGRVIVLTTHFMDEADLLGDRIAIMGDGKLVCCGSSLYLKRQYGVGYNMTMEKTSSINFNTKKLDSVITSKVKDALMITDAGKEITYQLPFTASAVMPSLFEEIDQNLANLGLESYGISITTLEEVFIKITQSTHTVQTADKGRKGDEVRKQAKPEDNIPAPGGGLNTDSGDEDVEAATWKEGGAAGAFSAVTFGRMEETEHLRYFVRHFYALIVKRALYFQRDKKAWIFTFIVPFLFLLAGMLILQYATSDTSQPRINISRSMYNSGISSNRLPTPYSKNTLGSSQANPGRNSIFCNTAWPSSTGGNGYSYCSDFDSHWADSAVSSWNDAASDPLVAATSYSVYNTSQYLWQHRADYKASQFGAYTFNNGPGTVQSSIGCLYGQCPASYYLHTNFTALHAAPLFGAMLAEGALRSQSGASAATLSVAVHPFGLTAHQSQVASGFAVDTVVTFLMLAVPFVPAAIATFIVREREVKAKHQQVVSGVGLAAYWLSTFLWDQMAWMITLFLFVVVICGPVFGSNTGLLGGNGQLEACGRLFSLLYLFGAAVSGFTYLISFVFTSPAMAQIALIFIVFITGLVLSIIGIVLRILPDTRDVFKLWVRYVFCLFPPYALGDGLHSMALISTYSQFELTGGKQYSVLDWQITGLPLMMLGWEAAVFLLLTILYEWLGSIPKISGVFARIGRTLPPDVEGLKDDDVLAEEQRVGSGAANESTILVKDFRKMYGTGKYAVKGVSLGIPNGECFGLLGINGAGKSTTLSMLSGEFPPTSGEGYLAGLDLLTDIHTCRRKIGFCPQFDSLFELLTGREHLELYARIKGINAEDIDKVVTGKIREMGLVEYADRYAGTYSGGNKRKLSVAIAMIGEPSIVFLDEPSTGMDPVARRFMWDVITDIVTKREKCSLILTTHSMEECEALCTRIGIMVGGVLRCLGSAQHLRSKYGDGLQIEIGFVLPSPEEIAQHAQHILGLLGKTLDASGDNAVDRAAVIDAFSKLGKQYWADRVADDGTGNDLHSSLVSAGSVGVKHLAQWCLLEVIYDDVSLFLATSFGAYVQRERQPSKLRVEITARLPDGSPRLLSQTFGALESNKVRLQIQEYSIAQTSLEQIFNGFASQQEEESSNPNATTKAPKPANQSASI